MTGITIYTMDGCPFCIKAKAFLKKEKLHYKEIKIKPGSKTWDEMIAKTGSKLMPQIIVDGEAIGGYGELVDLHSSGALNKMLELPLDDEAPHMYDVCILGGGPAGLNAALYASRKVLKTILISQNIGGQVADTYDVENYLGFGSISTIDLIQKFDEHVAKYGIEKKIGDNVVGVDMTGKTKKTILASGEVISSKTIIIATGKRPRQLNVEGEKKLAGRGVAYCATCDAPLFADADVAVIGGGNSALEAVIDLDKVARKIYVISLTPLTGDPILQNRISKSSKVKVYTRYETLKILGEQMVEGIVIKSLSTHKQKEIAVEGVFIEIGLLPNSDLVIDTLSTNPLGEIKVDAKCCTGMSGIFACGDVTDVPYKQAIIAAGEGAKAALSAYEFIINQR